MTKKTNACQQKLGKNNEEPEGEAEGNITSDMTRTWRTFITEKT
jgi:hypothetical protein